MAVFKGLLMKGLGEKDAAEQNYQPTNPWMSVVVVYLLSLLYNIQ